MNFAALDFTIIGPALAAGCLVLATHVLLGREVLRRGIIFIDLAVAQMAAIGVIGASTMGFEAHGLAAQLAAFAAALLGGIVLSWTDARFGQSQEALIGVSFVLAATGSILLLANNPRGGEELQDILVGQILWVNFRGLGPAAIATVLVLAAWPFVTRRFGRVGFYLLFAVSVTVSVQLVGIYLVFASLIVPALAIRNYGARALPAGYVIGILGYITGLMISAVFDLPTGAVIVWTLAVTALAGRALLLRSRSAAIA
jgi:zinc/manganese transport system permease protein